MYRRFALAAALAGSSGCDVALRVPDGAQLVCESDDDCTSGQRSGFAGVELTSEADSKRAIRLTRDPVRGNLLILEAPGSSLPSAVIEAKACSRFDLKVDRTSPTINDIVVVEGSATLDCPDISGHVTFEGCH